MRTYYCRDCEVGVGRLTQDQALDVIAEGHTLFSDPGPMPVADALADAATLVAALEPRGRTRWDARAARRAGSDAVVVMLSVFAGDRVADLAAASYARDAARLFFKLAPGLRA